MPSNIDLCLQTCLFYLYAAVAELSKIRIIAITIQYIKIENTGIEAGRL